MNYFLKRNLPDMIKRKGYFKVFLVLLFILLCHVPFNAHAAQISGRILDEDGPLECAKVYVYKEYADIKDDSPITVSEPADSKGVYKLELPQGEYYFVAKGKKDGKDYFSYRGNNPIRVESENLWVTMIANETKPPVYTEGKTSIKGTVIHKGKQLDKFIISFYHPKDRGFKRFGFRTYRVDSGKPFDFELPTGRFVVIARKIHGSERLRPLLNGDLYCYFSGNPVEIKQDRSVSVEIPCYPKGDRDSYVTEHSMKPDDYVTMIDQVKEQKHGIKGTVTDREGTPVEGLFVLVYKVEYDRNKMMSKILSGNRSADYFVTTDKDGNYFIPMDGDMDLRLQARDTMGRPKTGDTYGAYVGRQGQIIYYKKGQLIENINIVVGKITMPEDRGKREEE
jgi:hypothetical protein